MKKQVLLLVACLIAGISFAVWAQFALNTSDQPQSTLTPIAGKSFGGDFTLKTGDGKSVSLSDYRGKVVLMYFGYASCPDVCPTSMALLGTALKRLEAEEVAQIQGLSELKQVAKQYGSFFGKADESSSSLGYLVDHSSRTYVIGKEGQLAHLLPHDKTIPEVVTAIRAALN